MPVTCCDPEIERIAARMRAEFKEMPGMRLTEAQARRLWNLARPECDAALEHLVETGELVCDQKGRYRGHDIPEYP